MDGLWDQVYEIDTEVDLYAKTRALERSKIHFKILGLEKQVIEERLKIIKARKQNNNSGGMY